MNVDISKLKDIVKETINVARGLYLLPYNIKFESFKKINDHYEIAGTYEYKLLLTDELVEAGKFKVVLNEKMEVISLEITPIQNKRDRIYEC